MDGSGAWLIFKVVIWCWYLTWASSWLGYPLRMRLKQLDSLKLVFLIHRLETFVYSQSMISKLKSKISCDRWCHSQTKTWVSKEDISTTGQVHNLQLVSSVIMTEIFLNNQLATRCTQLIWRQEELPGSLQWLTVTDMLVDAGVTTPVVELKLVEER